MAIADSQDNKRFKTIATGLVIGLLGTVTLAISGAQAEFRMCNKTTATIGVAVGYQIEKEWTTEGWWNLPANKCEVLVEGPLRSRYYYVYAIDYQNGGEWSGEAYMCTRERAFTIKGIADCVARGFERTGFYEVDTSDKQSWTVQLKEPDEAGIGGQ